MSSRDDRIGSGDPGHPGTGRPGIAGAAGWLRRHWLLTLVAGIVVLVLAIRFLRRPAGEPDEEAAAVVTAQTAVARVGPFDVTIPALGTVQPRPDAFAQVAAPAASRVASVLVATGDRVRAGQALVRLDGSVWLLQARQARVALDAAQQAYDRADRLFTEGISPKKDVESAASDLARARAELESAQRTESLGTLRSPIDGVVTELMASLSQPVNENQPLVEVVNPAGLEVQFHLSPAEAARVSPGAAVELNSGTGATGEGAYLGRGTITGVSAAVDSATGGVIVRATLANPMQPLKAGETVSGRLVVAHRDRAVVVPASALVPTEGGFQVFVVDRGGLAHATPVTVGGRNEAEAEVTAGLEGGETVVAAGAYGVSDSARIRRPEAAPATATGGE